MRKALLVVSEIVAVGDLFYEKCDAESTFTRLCFLSGLLFSMGEPKTVLAWKEDLTGTYLLPVAKIAVSILRDFLCRVWKARVVFISYVGFIVILSCFFFFK